MVIKLYSRIKELRQINNYTMLEIANKLGVSEATYQRYETGKIKSIPYEKIEMMSNIFNCPPAYLMGWEDELNTADKTNDIEKIQHPLTTKQQTLLNLFDQLNEEGQEKVIDNADDLVASGKYKKHSESEVLLTEEEA